MGHSEPRSAARVATLVTSVSQDAPFTKASAVLGTDTIEFRRYACPPGVSTAANKKAALDWAAFCATKPEAYAAASAGTGGTNGSS